ncbi:MAG TPA: hypothetical protein VF984_03565 [Actinomycetota bacterium]
MHLRGVGAGELDAAAFGAPAGTPDGASDVRSLHIEPSASESFFQG